jgi:hypothetical protein
MKIFIGWDSREDIAYQIAKKSILLHSDNIEIYPIKQNMLRELGIYTRELDSKASTEFTLTRFLTPFLSDYSGISIFMDCDMLVQVDINSILKEIDYKDPVTCVQHVEYTPKSNLKMDGKQQHYYPKKNWSSFMVFNCGHPSLKNNLSVKNINTKSPQYLHRMEWATSIGKLSHTWNYLAGYYNDIKHPNVIHYTDGGPWFDNYKNCPFSENWFNLRKQA